MKKSTLSKLLIGLIVIFLCNNTNLYSQSKKLQIISVEYSKSVPKLHSAYYISNNELFLRSKNFVSDDNGKSWQNHFMSFRNGSVDLKNSRRSHVTSLYINKSNRIIHFINTIDIKGIGYRKIGEIPEGINNYYIRYYLSDPKSRFYINDLPIKESRNSNKKPFSGINIGTNAFYLGDIGCQPIELSNGNILVPVQQSIIKNEKIFNPGGMTTFTGVRVLIGSINPSGSKIDWKASDLVQISETKSTRGLIEPTIIEVDDGKLLMVMRGSNGGKLDKGYFLPGYKWYSISNNYGKSWSVPKELRYDDNSELFSPSSMSRLFKKSNGKIYWIGNISSSNPQANNPRNILSIAEVDPISYKIKKSTMVVLETRDKNVSISHFSVLEDRNNKNIIITYPIIKNNEKEWGVIRLR